MASNETVDLSEQHAPKQASIDAFSAVEGEIKAAIVKSRKDWDIHAPYMWEKASGVSDAQLAAFDIASDLVAVRDGVTSYGQIIFGKIKIPALADKDPNYAFVHVRVHDTPGDGQRNVIFHSLFTEEHVKEGSSGGKEPGAIRSKADSLEFFNE